MTNLTGENSVKTRETEGSAVSHDVALAAQLLVTFVAAEVFHVPRQALGLGALVGENDLVARAAARLQAFGVMPTAEQSSFLQKVDQVDKELFAHGARETRRVPADVGSCAGGEHAHVAAGEILVALKRRRFRSVYSVCLSI